MSATLSISKSSLMDLVDRFTDAQSADGVRLEAERNRLAGAFFAEFRDHPALYDPELCLPRIRHDDAVDLLFAQREQTMAGATCPAQRQTHRTANLVDSRRMREALVEHHGDVGSERGLDVHGELGGEDAGAAIEMRSEGDAALVDLPPRRQAEDLVAAAVGEDRP